MANNKSCSEWYKLEDGETPSKTVYTSGKKLLKDIKNGIFIHVSNLKHCIYVSSQNVLRMLTLVSGFNYRGGAFCASLLLSSHHKKETVSNSRYVSFLLKTER